jgi:hypothetical protein
LARALRVSIAGLRPWEYDAMDADRYAEIEWVTTCWAEAQQRAEAERLPKPGAWRRG